MVLCPEPIFKAVEKLRLPAPNSLPGRQAGQLPAKTILLSPKGKKLDQRIAWRLSRQKHLILICGHYEGIDERVREKLVDEEISIGDYVLTGGELPAMVLVDCITRLIPGVLGDKNSLNSESFEGNLLEYPQYTRPANFRNMTVPEILTCGDHRKIAEWRKKEALKITKKKRPDLLRSKKPR
jgi:tRNA (guanine37-N1)-methyltransferase